MPKSKLKYQPNHESLIATRNFFATIFGSKYPTFRILLLVILFIIISGWLPELLSELLSQIVLIPSIKILSTEVSIARMIQWVICLLIIGYFIFGIKRLNKYFSPLVVNVDENPQPVKSLLVFLSPIGTISEAEKSFFREIIPEANNIDKREQIIKILSKNSKIIHAFRVVFDKNWSWAMPVKAIEYHKNWLEYLYVITSTQTHNDFDNFTKLINLFFPESNFYISEYPEGTTGINFSDVKAIYDQVNAFFDEMKKKKLKDSEILVDVTGGLVTTSIGAVMATLTRGRSAEYVSTIDRRVRTYDITYSEED